MHSWQHMACWHVSHANIITLAFKRRGTHLPTTMNSRGSNCSTAVLPLLATFQRMKNSQALRPVPDMPVTSMRTFEAACASPECTHNSRKPVSGSEGGLSMTWQQHQDTSARSGAKQAASPVTFSTSACGTCSQGLQGHASAGALQIDTTACLNQAMGAQKIRKGSISTLRCHSFQSCTWKRHVSQLLVAITQVQFPGQPSEEASV